MSIEGCANCLKSPEDVGKTKFGGCYACALPKYCSRECQLQHWRSSHKAECQGRLKGLRAQRSLIKSWVANKGMRLISATIVACQGQPYDQVALVLDLRCSPEGNLTYISHALEPLLAHEDEKTISVLHSNESRVVIIKSTNEAAMIEFAVTVPAIPFVMGNSVSIPYQEFVAAVIQKGVTVAECINNDIEFMAM